MKMSTSSRSLQKTRMKWPAKEHMTPPQAPINVACHGFATRFATEPMATPPAILDLCASKMLSFRLPLKIADADSPAIELPNSDKYVLIATACCAACRQTYVYSRGFRCPTFKASTRCTLTVLTSGCAGADVRECV